MDILHTRLEVQGATQQWVDSFMQQHDIPAFMMEDALNKVLVNLKDKTVTEFLIAASAATSVSEGEDANDDNN